MPPMMMPKLMQQMQQTMQQMQQMMSQGKMTPEAMKEMEGMVSQMQGMMNQMQGMMQTCQTMMQQMGGMMGTPPQPQEQREKEIDAASGNAFKQKSPQPGFFVPLFLIITPSPTIEKRVLGRNKTISK